MVERVMADGGACEDNPAVWPADRSVPLRDLSIGELLIEAAGKAPERTAIVAGVESNGWTARRWTYAELLHDVEALAQRLLELFRPGDRLAISAANGPEWELVELGAACAGLTLIPLNTSSASAELAYILRQSRAAGLVIGTQGRIGEQAEELRPRLPHLREVLDIGPGSGLWEPASRSVTLPDVSPESPALIQYTSGTTGAPKGVVISHHAAVNNGSLSASKLELADGAVWLNPLPMYHVNGSIFFALGAISQAATHVIAKFDPRVILDLIERERVTYMTGVPTILHAVMQHRDFPDRDLSSLELVTTGGTTILPALIRDVAEKFGVSVLVMFGQTEVGGAIAMTSRDDSVEVVSSCVGRPLAQTEVKIAASGDGRPVGRGHVGEICARSASVFTEYFDMPEATAKAFDSDGWLRTGDLGSMDDEGRISVTGRLKDLIIRGGENIYPRAIEEVLTAHPDIADVAVVGVADDYYGEVVAAVVTVATGAEPSIQGWASFAAEHLSKRKVPAQWFVVDQMPLTTSGKIQKFRLQELITTGDLVPVVDGDALAR